MATRARTAMIALLAIGGSPWLAGPITAQTWYLPASVGDLSNCKTVEIKDSTGKVVLRGQFVRQAATGDDVEREAVLSGSGATADAKGEAEVEVTRVENRLEQELELSVTNLAPGATYSVVIDAKQVGTFITDKAGSAEVEMTTPPRKP